MSSYVGITVSVARHNEVIRLVVSIFLGPVVQALHHWYHLFAIFDSCCCRKHSPLPASVQVPQEFASCHWACKLEPHLFTLQNVAPVSQCSVISLDPLRLPPFDRVSFAHRLVVVFQRLLKLCRIKSQLLCHLRNHPDVKTRSCAEIVRQHSVGPSNHYRPLIILHDYTNDFCFVNFGASETGAGDSGCHVAGNI